MASSPGPDSLSPHAAHDTSVLIGSNRQSPLKLPFGHPIFWHRTPKVTGGRVAWLRSTPVSDNGCVMHLLERQQQLAALNRCVQDARAGSGKLVLVAGEAGLGKSALVERFVSEHRRDVRTLWGACDGLSTPRPLAPVHEIAAQTSELGGRVAQDDKSRDWLFRVLLEDLALPERPCVVVLEDLHWAD